MTSAESALLVLTLAAGAAADRWPTKEARRADVDLYCRCSRVQLDIVFALRHHNAPMLGVALLDYLTTADQGRR
jgi:hypothetical protein